MSETDQNTKNNMAIYVSSYDGCCDLWNPFFYLFHRFWDPCVFPIYLINNLLDYSDNKVKVINTGAEKDWFDRTIRSLKEINHKYILFMLEDYFLSKKVNNKDFIEIVEFMEKNQVYYYQLSNGNTKSHNSMRTAINAKSPYAISLQPAIWNRDVFIKILEEIDGKTPWDVEHYFVQKFDKKSGFITGAFCDTRDLLGYVNGVLRGKWILDTLNYYKKMGIDIEVGNREVMSKSGMIKCNIASFVNRNFPSGIKKIGKKICGVLHIDYLK